MVFKLDKGLQTHSSQEIVYCETVLVSMVGYKVKPSMVHTLQGSALHGLDQPCPELGALPNIKMCSNFFKFFRYHGKTRKNNCGGSETERPPQQAFHFVKCFVNNERTYMLCKVRSNYT